jgi:hypothetical protein
MPGSDTNKSEVPIFVSFTRRQWITFFVILGVVLFAVFGWMWYDRIYNSPQRAFWGMIDNNLATRGVTRTITQEGDSGNSEQIVQLSFNGDTRAHTMSTIAQGSGQQASIVTSEAVGSPSGDYIRYTRLDPTGKKADGSAYNFSDIINVWGKSANNNQQSNFLVEAMFGLVPVGNLSPATRAEIVNVIKSKNVYDIDYSKEKRVNEGGHAAYSYPVKINLQAYVEVLELYFKSMGVGGSGLDASSYAGQTANVTFIVDAHSHQMLKITYGDNPRTESYSGYGVVDLATLPQKTENINVLQQRLQQDLNGSGAGGASDGSGASAPSDSGSSGSSSGSSGGASSY